MKVKHVVALVISILVLISTAFFTLTPGGRQIINGYGETLQRADDESLYKTRKQVEDQLRGMISRYEQNVSTYNKYKDSENQGDRDLAQAAWLQANKTAINYNEFFTKNSFVWRDNVPYDLPEALRVLE